MKITTKVRAKRDVYLPTLGIIVKKNEEFTAIYTVGIQMVSLANGTDKFIIGWAAYAYNFEEIKCKPAM